MIEWVVKVAEGVNPDAIADRNGFVNKGPVRGLPNSYVFSLLPEYQNPEENQHKISQLQNSPEIQAFISFHPDKINEYFKQEFERMEKESPGSASRVLESLKNDDNAELKEKAKEPFSKITALLSKQAPKSTSKNEWVVLLKDSVNADHVAHELGFINRGKVKDSPLNNYIFRLQDQYTTNDIIKQNKVKTLQQDARVMDVLLFDLETLKRKREEVLNRERPKVRQQFISTINDDL